MDEDIGSPHVPNHCREGGVELFIERRLLALYMVAKSTKSEVCGVLDCLSNLGWQHGASLNVPH